MPESLQDLEMLDLERLLRAAKASGLKRRAPGSSTITPVERGEPLALSYAQQRLWFLAQMEGVSQAYHIAGGLRLTGELDRTALRRALDALVARHEALRTTFHVLDGNPVQRIAAQGCGFCLLEHDWTERANTERELEKLASLEAGAAFDLQSGPLIRGRLVELGARQHVLFITMHHIVSDGWSMGILVKELAASYAAYRAGDSDPLPALPIQYADYAAWQRRWLTGEALEVQGAYWEETLSGAPALLEVPTDHPRPPLQGHGGALIELELDERLTAELKALSQRHGTTLFMTLLSAWATLLARLGNVDDLVIGTPVANRARPEVQGLVGFFVNTLALRLDLSGQPSVGELLQRVKRHVLRAQQHQDLPFERVVEVAKPRRSLAHSPLFQVMFAWQIDDAAELELPGLTLTPVSAPSTVAKFDLTLTLAEVGPRIAGALEYATTLFERETIARYVGYLRSLLEAMVKDDRQGIHALPLLGAAERRQLLVTWNATDTDYSSACVHESFESQAAANPRALALVEPGRQLTYGELNARANRLAHHLRTLGVKPDARVAICIERSVEVVVALLATLKAGGAYVPLDPTYPEARLRYMLEDSAPIVVLAHSNTQSRLRAASSFAAQLHLTVDVQHDSHIWQNYPDTNPERSATGLSPEHLAYVIYTSGSTGNPKGVMIEHRGLTNYCCWAVGAYRPAGAGALVSSSLSFDATVTSLLTPLLCGSWVRLLPEEDELQALQSAVGAPQGCGLVKITPAHLDVLGRLIRSQDTRSTASVLVVGGEALPPSTVQLWRQIQPDVRIVNEYGPTETVVGCVVYEVPEAVDPSRPVPIGRPIANTRIYILDAHGQPVPIGIIGEIYIAGAGVARGYLNQPELTAQRFVPDPHAAQAGARMYKTGDLARYLPDGNIEFLGRNDSQVKLRGFRIELGEIEARLAEHPAIRDVLVLAREDSPGDRRLVAYYTLATAVGPEALDGGPEQGAHTSVTAEALRARLSSGLPDYMVPAAYVRLDTLPLTPNGKVDRRALPAPGLAAYTARGYEAPLGEVEAMLAEIWADLLAVERVGRHDDFFELGGHSLLAVRLIERMRQAGLHADVRTLFATPRLAALAAGVARHAHSIEAPANPITVACDAITPEMLPLVQLTASEIARVVSAVPGGVANVQDIYPLAPLQEGILFHHLSGTKGDPYLSSCRFAFHDRARLDAYLGALQAVIERHDVLRTAVLWEGLHEPVQVVWRRAPLLVDEVGLDPADGDIAEQLAARFDSRRYRLDVRQAPLMRAATAWDPVEARWLLSLSFHHLASDHATLTVVVEEIHAHLRGRAGDLPAPVPFRNFVARARAGLGDDQHERFFRQMLGDVETPTTPLALSDVQGDGSNIAEGRLSLEPALAGRLRNQARRLGVTAASLCHVAWAQVLARLSARDDVVFGTVLFGRMQGGAGADRVVGMFINTLPLRVRVGDDGVENTVRATHLLLTELLRHEHASLALAQRCSAVEAPAPLFSTLFNYRHTAAASRSVETPQEGMEFLGSEERSNYPLALSVDDLGEGFALTAQVEAGVDPGRICAFMHTALARLVTALEEAPAAPIRSLDVMPAAERERLLVEWNATDAEHPTDRCIHELFEARAWAQPDASAVEHAGGQLTYGELDARANQLARHLRGLGVVPDARVALCVERNMDMVVALLAVLKAGGAYVPLDPACPAARLAYLVVDCAPVVVVSDASVSGETRAKLLTALGEDSPGANPCWVELHTDAWRWENQPSTALEASGVAASPEHLAYVIYTSGSTGKPKGVMVEHRQVANLIGWHCAAFGLIAGQRSSSVANVAFDAAAWEIWPTLCAGATLVLPPAGVGRDAEALLVWWRAQELDVSFLPTPIAQLAFAQAPGHARLGTLLVGGDRLRQLPAQPQTFELVNNYGPTETTVVATSGRLDASDGVLHLGRPIANTRVYLLDAQRRPVPVGAIGEIYIGGAGVARGYLNRPELTAERFLEDPFASRPGARVYKTGDLGRYLPDGNLEFVGRDDHQVKIRGYRIELGEIETRLGEHPAVGDAVVVAREDNPGGARLVAYYTLRAVDGGASDADGLAAALQAHLSALLPEYMLPVAYVLLETLPLTSNGKVDRQALRAPEGGVQQSRPYEAPLGDAERKLAAIWGELLHLERVGRHDHFFELGGHSLLAVSLIERMRQAGLHADVRTLFATPTLAALAAAARDPDRIAVPPNRIPVGCEQITPELLPLVQLTADEIERVVSTVPGGAANVQDIYPLAPLQQGILFHHLIGAEGDPYLLTGQLGFDSRTRLDDYLRLLQAVIDRHDVLRTSVLWEGLPEPVQVVWRKSPLAVEEVAASGAGGDVARQLAARFDPRHYRLDLRRAPLMRAFITHDAARERWVLLLVFHHLCGDHTTLALVQQEVEALGHGRGDELPTPLPFRDFVARARSGQSQEEHEAFFRQMLGDVDTPTTPFGLTDVQGDGSGLIEARRPVDSTLARRLRNTARALGVSAASICHVAWAQVLARLSGQDDVVFGTVLFGRMHAGAGADRVLGMFINTLPVRIGVAGESVEATVRAAQLLLADLLRHEHASLALAQRCSAVPGSTPLFSTLFNYRHTNAAARSALPPGEGIEFLGGGERTSYPLAFSVDDLGDGFALSAQAQLPLDAEQICAFMQTALTLLVESLERAPGTPIGGLDVMPARERRQLLVEWNATGTEYQRARCVHELFEVQAAEHPETIALEHETGQLTYAELDARADELARHLRAWGVGPDARVAVCLERGVDMIVSLLAVLKAGGAYVPLDPSSPSQRLDYMLEDSAPVVVITHTQLPAVRRCPGFAAGALPVLHVDADAATWAKQPSADRERTPVRPSPEHLAYVIYTSGSTGKPKGVMVEHRNLTHLIGWHCAAFGSGRGQRSSCVASVGFDAAAWEIWPALCAGGTLVLAPARLAHDPEGLLEWWRAQPLDISFLPTPIAQLAFEAGSSHARLGTLLVGGDRLRQVPRATEPFTLINNYGPTETSVVATSGRLDGSDRVLHIGRPIANTRIYLLDVRRQPVPLGAVGEIYIGGAGVARGYLNRPELTAERFLEDPFSDEAGARMYRSGDLGRYLPNGNLEFVGRNDAQVKIRGFRVELGEIEARLVEHPAIGDAVVLAREDRAGNPRLVAYYTLAAAPADAAVGAASALHAVGATPDALRAHLAALLPDYMLPVAYVGLDALPLTRHGKVDRRALPAPEEGLPAEGVYEAPAGEVEIALARIWAELLELERVGRHDRFFELGGHSILATTLTSRLRQQFQVELPLRAVFHAPDLAALAHVVSSAIQDGQTCSGVGMKIDLQAEATLPADIRPRRASSERVPARSRGVLLTGVTGFLGSFLLHELLLHTDAPVYCLVRAATDVEAEHRLRSTLERYGLAQPESLARAVAVAADLELPGLGLTPERFQTLADEVDSIYHSAALVSFVHSYQAMKAANVLGTQEILRLACEGDLKPVHYVSTLSIFPHDSEAPRRYREDHDMEELRDGLTDAYAQSKWVAEKLVRIAGSRGLPVSIYRMGRIGAHSRTGVWNPDDFGCRMIRASLRAGIVPTGEWMVKTVPVDYVSRAIVHLSRSTRCIGKTYHLVNPSSITADAFVRCLRRLGYPVQQVPPDSWRDELTRAAQDDPQHPLYAVAPLLLAAARQQASAANTAPHPTEFDCTNTLLGVEGSGITCPRSDEEMVSAALGYLVRTGAIPPPSPSPDAAPTAILINAPEAG